MKVIMVMFDSLNRRMLPPYGCAWTHMPNFTRLAHHTATFDRAYVGSMPCMPTHTRNMFTVDELQNIELSAPFPFTKGCKVMKIAMRHSRSKVNDFGALLFDLENDPKQEHPLNDERIEQTMIAHLERLMKAHNAPAEQFTRLGIPAS